MSGSGYEAKNDKLMPSWVKTLTLADHFADQLDR
jgi:hypothetical protein